MHPEALEFVHEAKRRWAWFFHAVRVLEVGSRDINGTPRALFSDCDYVGIDAAEGPGVDWVGLAGDYKAGAPFDVALTLNTFEHDPYLEASARGMVRALRPGGLLMAGAASDGWPEHGTPRTPRPHGNHYGPIPEYYRTVSAQELRRLFPDALFSRSCVSQLWHPDGRSEVFLWGIKR